MKCSAWNLNFNKCKWAKNENNQLKFQDRIFVLYLPWNSSAFIQLCRSLRSEDTKNKIITGIWQLTNILHKYFGFYCGEQYKFQETRWRRNRALLSIFHFISAPWIHFFSHLSRNLGSEIISWKILCRTFGL